MAKTPMLVIVSMVAACSSDPGAELIGSWVEAITPNQAEGRLDVMVYRDNGTWQFGAGGSGNAGQWNVEGDRVFTLPDGTLEKTSDTQFAVDGERLLTDVMRPLGDVDGLLGGWRGTAHTTGGFADTYTETEYRVGLNADGTGSYSVLVGEDLEAYDGVWRQDGYFLFLATSQGTLDFIVAPGAIARRHWQRVDE